MLPIQDCRVLFESGKYVAECNCGKISLFSAKNSALIMLNKGFCRHCKKDYRATKNVDLKIYQNNFGKWCSTCSGCGAEQAYTRMDHAKQSELSGWQCKGCVAKAKGYENNKPVGDRQRTYNRFKKAANNRGIVWNLAIDEMFESFTGECKLSGWPIKISYFEQTASLDRIDSTKPYIAGNVQWVHTMVNMCKNKYDQDLFIDMCKAIANKVKW